MHSKPLTLISLSALLVGAACATAPPAAAPPTDAPTTASHPQRDPDATPTARPKVSHPGPQPGDPAPALDAVAWFRGAAPRRGEPYLIFFWGTWCKPCKAVVPQTLAYAEARGLTLIGLSRDSAENLEAFVASWAAPFIERLAYEHPRYPLHLAYDAFSVPRLIEVNADGRIEAVHYGVVGIKALAPAP